MKKVVIIGIIFIAILTNVVQAMPSESFQRILSMINVPIYNKDGYEINEEIYQKYNLIVYGNPQKIKQNQRWKDTPNGKWINENTKKQGEYRILGYSLTGTVVNNEAFPDDYTSGTSPEDWNYIVINDALNTWNDTEKYQTKEQLEYMLNHKLMRNGVSYNLTASSIGLDKTRIEAYATWKTSGSIFTQKRDSVGNIWEATFTVPAIAADATLEATLNIENNEKYIFTPEQETIEIPISFGAHVSNLGEYAKKEDIKSLSSELEIENNLCDKVISEKTTEVQDEHKLVISKSDYSGINQIELTIKNTAILETCFHSEAPFVNIKEVTISIVFNEEEQKEEYIEVKNNNRKYDNEIPKPIIGKINLYRKSIQGAKQKINLYIAKTTGVPFISAGQILVAEVQVKNKPDIVTFAIEGDSRIQTLDNLTKKFVYDEPKEQGENMIYSSLNALKKSYDLPAEMIYKDGMYRLEYIIPYEAKQSLHSWNTLRNENNNAFQIDSSKLFSRITSPYKISIYAKNAGGVTTKTTSLDVFERWDTIYNRDIKEYVK